VERNVYIVEAQWRPEDDGDNLRRNNEMRSQIFDLAQREGEEIFFHRYRLSTAPTGPHVLVECTPEFFEKIKQLPLMDYGHQLWARLETFRTGHGGPVDLALLNRVLAQQDKSDWSLHDATWALHEDILDLAKVKGLEGQALIRHIDGDRGFLSLICPDSLVPDIESLPRCRALVKPGQAAKIFHRPPQP
jgi:hypothetical protein